MKIRINQDIELGSANKVAINIIEQGPMLRLGVNIYIVDSHMEDDVLVIDEMETMSVDLSKDFLHYEP